MADDATHDLVAVETNEGDEADKTLLQVSKQPTVVTRPQWFF